MVNLGIKDTVTLWYVSWHRNLKASQVNTFL